MMPDVAEAFLPEALARARTNCPTLMPSALPTFTGVSPDASTLRRAMSVYGSLPTTFASNSLPSLCTTVGPVECPTTWLAVTTSPSEDQTIPVPPLLPAFTFTTEGETLSASSVTAFENDCNSCIP